MKKIALLFLLVLPILAFSQGKSILAKSAESYDGTTLDTLAIGGLEDYTAMYIAVTATDSISMVVKIAGTNDGTTFESAVTVDSLVTTAAGGKDIALTTALGGWDRSLVILDCVHFPGAQSANSGATYTARFTLKK